MFTQTHVYAANTGAVGLLPTSSILPPPPCRDQAVYGGTGFSLTRLRLQVQESLDKVREAIDFLVRGLRLLGSDVANSSRVFGRAALGECRLEHEGGAPSHEGFSFFDSAQSHHVLHLRGRGPSL